MRALRLHRACSAETKQPFRTWGKAGLYTLNTNSLMVCWHISDLFPVIEMPSGIRLEKSKSFWMFSLTCVLFYFKYWIFIKASIHSFIPYMNIEQKTQVGSNTNLGSYKKVYKINEALAFKELTIWWLW